MLGCGHNFCKACISRCWEESTRTACPQCRGKNRFKRLRPNWKLASMVGLVNEITATPKLEAAEWSVCWKHQEPLKLFCQNDGTSICVVCDRSKEHRSHLVVPLEEAAQEVKDKISRSQEILRKEKEYIVLHKVENENESKDLLKQMEAEREKARNAFRKQHQFLEDQETLLLAQMDEVEVEIAKRRDEHQASLSGELSTLNNLIQELEEKLQQSANELLQDLGNILERCQKESSENPIAFPVALKWRIHDLSDVSPFLEGIVKDFQDSLISGLPLQEANVTLDPDTAHAEVLLSESRNEEQYLPERFDFWCYVLGCEGFTSGRHFWEVTIGSEDTWYVGVARQTVRRKGDFYSWPKKGFWAMGMYEGKYVISNPPDYSSLSLSQRVRVTLNCAGGRVAFFDADTGEKLHVYSDASLCRETLLPLFYIEDGGHLALCH